MPPNPDSARVPWWLKLLPLILFLSLWQLIVPHVAYGTYFYGSPALVWRALLGQASQGVLWTNVGNTALAVLIGFVVGNALGIGVGLAFAFFPRVAAVFRPYLAALGSVPVIAFAPMILLVFGTRFLPKIVLSAFATSVVAASQTFEGATQTPPAFIALLESLGANRLTVFRKVVIPSSLLWFFSGLRLNVGVAILAVFIAEFISSQSGVGYQIVVDMGLFKTSGVLAGVALIALFSLALTGLIGWLQRRFRQWNQPR